MALTNFLIKAILITTVTLGGAKITLDGTFPKVGDTAPDFTLVNGELKDISLSDFKGKRVLLNIFPSLDTKTCAMSVREFNEKAADMKNTVVLAISKDLPFAQFRFCSTEGIKNLIPLSAFRNESFGKDYGVAIKDSPMAGLLARAVIIIDENGKIIYTELVPELRHEPNYKAALAALK